MDDDAPLSALKAKPKFDDDAPLAALCKKPAPKAPAPAKKPSAPPGEKKAPSAAGTTASAKLPIKAAQPAGAKKRAGSSSSSSSGSSSSSSSNSAAKRRTKAARLKKGASTATVGGEDNDENYMPKRGGRTPKESVVAELLCRWWYVLPDWPPKDPEFYEAELTKQNYRRVDINNWEWVPEVDDRGRKKVYELQQYRGVYRDSLGGEVDLRPRDSCPCQNNLMKKDLPDLYQMLVAAYENQVKDIENSPYSATANARHKIEIMGQLARVREKAQQVAQMGSWNKKK